MDTSAAQRRDRARGKRQPHRPRPRGRGYPGARNRARSQPRRPYRDRPRRTLMSRVAVSLTSFSGGFEPNDGKKARAAVRFLVESWRRGHRSVGPRAARQRGALAPGIAVAVWSLAVRIGCISTKLDPSRARLPTSLFGKGTPATSCPSRTRAAWARARVGKAVSVAPFSRYFTAGGSGFGINFPSFVSIPDFPKSHHDVRGPVRLVRVGVRGRSGVCSMTRARFSLTLLPCLCRSLRRCKGGCKCKKGECKCKVSGFPPARIFFRGVVTCARSRKRVEGWQGACGVEGLRLVVGDALGFSPSGSAGMSRADGSVPDRFYVRRAEGCR